MLTAKEALAASQRANDTRISQELANIKEEIAKAITGGDTRIFVYDALSCRASDRLRQLGYRVSSCTQRNEHTTTIDWSQS